jgi:hypothetical protein
MKNAEQVLLEFVKERMIDLAVTPIKDNHLQYFDRRVGYPIPEPEILEHLNNPDINMVFIPNRDFLFNFYQ